MYPLLLSDPMGILKIGCQTSVDDSCVNHSFYALGVDDKGRKEKSISGEDSGDDSGDCELAEVGCELIMFQGQLLNIPYELYDLPDLKDILSLETWNCCLTEDERFILSAYLPDMDQETFWLTMKELLGGNDIFFDSPLAEFWRKLKDGFYHERVTCYKGGLHFLQRVAYCHSLRSYHENIISAFSDMKRLWDPCGPRIGVEERIRIWNSWKNHNEGVNSVDLNAYPEDEILLSNDGNAKLSMFPLSKKMASTDSERIDPDIVCSPLSHEFVPLNTSLKGFLKRRPTGLNPFKCEPKAAPIDDWVCQPPPNGILKIVRKGPVSQQEHSRAMPMQSEVSPLIEDPFTKTSRLSASLSALHRWDVRDHEESLFLHHKVGRTKSYRSTDPPDCILNQQTVEFVDDTTTQTISSNSFMRNVNGVDGPCTRITSLSGRHSEASSKGDDCSNNPPNVKGCISVSENCSKNLVQETLGSSKACTFSAKYYQRKQKMAFPQEGKTGADVNISDGISRKSEVNLWEHVMYTQYKDQMKSHHGINGGGSQKLYDQSKSIGLRDGFAFPKTYKRRKLLKDQSFDFVQPVPLETNFKFGLSQEGNTLCL